MKIRLGYVSVPTTIDNITYCKTMTFTNFNKLDSLEAMNKLQNLIETNFTQLEEVVRYNAMNNIHFFRLSHSLIPLATHSEVNFDYITPYLSQWKKIGDLFRAYEMRVDTHPDQFCVLNSERKDVVEATIQMLKFHHEMWQAMQYPGKAILHVGGGSSDKTSAIKRFKNVFLSLSKELQKMIILENDDKIFTALDVLLICEELRIPMVLDFHHYRCHHGDEDIIELLPRIISTWSTSLLVPKMHYSTGKSKKEMRSHSEYINSDEFIAFLDIIKSASHDVDIMLECKAKDMALFKLVRELKFKTNIKFIDETSFVI